VRLIVTRPKEDAEALQGKLEALGHEVVLSPLLEIGAIADTIIPDERYQLLTLTSANGARTLARHPDLPRLKNIPVLTVGPQSAEAARNAGFSNVAMAGGDAAGLADHIAQNRDPKRGPLLYVSGRDTAGDFTGRLESRGFRVIRVIAYEARAASELAPEARAAADAVFLYSPRTARVWAELAHRAHVDGRAMMHLCISRNAAAVLPENWPRRIAAAPTEAAMFDLIRTMDTEG
jgi:uroporphyrinogen-III synthase